MPSNAVFGRSIWVIERDVRDGNMEKLPENLGKDKYDTQLYWALNNIQDKRLAYIYDANNSDRPSKPIKLYATTRELNSNSDLSWRDRIAINVQNKARNGDGTVNEGAIVPTATDLLSLADAAIAALDKKTGDVNASDIIDQFAGLLLQASG